MRTESCAEWEVVVDHGERTEVVVDGASVAAGVSEIGVDAVDARRDVGAPKGMRGLVDFLEVVVRGGVEAEVGDDRVRVVVVRVEIGAVCLFVRKVEVARD